jgi:Cu(I)/Ag(I) efflux system membrane protein CusA/SilA
MVDAAIAIIENAHTHFEHWRMRNPDAEPSREQHWEIVRDSAVEVGPALLSSLLIITVSFLPVFALQGQEGRLFGPLAYTKSYAMAAAAALSITLVPVLMGMWIRGHLPGERVNPLKRLLLAAYRPAPNAVMASPRVTLALALALTLSAAWPVSRLGGEFLPPLDEGDLLCMLTALPGLSAERASALLQQTDRMILSVREVATVFGKAGHARTATDSAPLETFETTI